MRIRPGQVRPGDEAKTFVLTSDKGVVEWVESTPLPPGTGGGAGGFRNIVVFQAHSSPQANTPGVLPLIYGIRILRIEVSGACRLRFYASRDHRDADLTRAIDTRAEGNHGLMAEFIFSDTSKVLIASPAIDLANMEPDPVPEIPYTFTNLGSTLDPVEIKMIYHETERALPPEPAAP